MNATAFKRRGLALAMGSVMLVSAAQLGMRWGMLRLPQPEQWLAAVRDGHINTLALGVVLTAIGAYGLSMLCWLGALRDIPLSRAYSLLSISYALVYLLATALPFFNEALTVPRTVGVTLIVLGVVTINFRRSCDSDNSGKEFPR
ncbi:4-amino-4-deoxy-L-arabinose-phosphoundecaprenol flippase subunit ArnF [Pseudomonas sp. LP_7_YM]|uniref:4-amino-4-deoxy-L-arabinose-phosphoundecaprenol flippase subunit ArnF n=1 Tax=Pseudomonas sp. LP_7_YM TaxID=2485137 RepID=UPI00105D4FE0|nr:4-amino-4-deoxy-L-arabinose-phosphoundecaprenol flippase subunit ArnF [Pseudomonas sp. LP_7_YM]TDV72477.1 undecaprenyl phosphate-alpha-L-ara4N flippase subunit ArnF [Pseudomonas sp. LP_7_YM]